MTTKRVIAAIGLMGALALVTAACGGEQFPQTHARQPTGTSVPTSDAAASPQARLLAAAQRTSGEKTSRIGLTMKYSGGGTDPGSISGSGVIDLVHRQLSMTFQGTADGSDVTIELRVVGDTLYLDTGDSWVEVPLGGTDAQTPDPNSYLDYLQGVSGDAHVAGHEVVRGDDTTRYEATLDLDRALTRARSSAERSALAHAIGLLGDLKMPSTVWVDDLGRLRKVRVSMDLTAAARSLGVPPDSHPTIEMTLELYDFGVPVVVHAPAGAKSA
ncbi:MAG TPA: LppX_LprAFG lipoprotein, partial [Acidimicrobiia bacterium]